VGTGPVSDTAPSTPPATPPEPPPSTGGSLDSANTCALPDFQAELLRQVNAARLAGRSCGATAYPATAPLTWNAKLFDAAAGHSRDMAINNYFSHTGLDGRSVSQRVSATGYVWRAVGENIAAGQRDVASAMSSWLDSEGHCRNIMNPAYQDVALACVQQSGTTYGRYWTLVLARP
jgi:uncharacterized protein YkwD